MAVRLQMKLGVVAETERLPDSPDVVAVVEPTIGATVRSKGSLFLVVSGIGRGRKLREATSLVADAIQSEYYYDESAGLVVCLEKAIRNANRRLVAAREKLSLPDAPAGPVGIGVAVVRGNELYVVTSGPVEAYLVRQAHLLTLPDADRANGLPHEDTAPDVWRGEVTAGDSLILVSSNITRTLGAEELKDAVVTLHPQTAMEHLHNRFVAAGGSGSDGLLALEAREVAATAQRGRLVPARPAEPLAGAPDRSPIPLADSVAGGAAAATAAATTARSAAGGALFRFVHRLQDLLPRRGPHYRRVTPAASRREAQRRAAIAVLALLSVAAVVVLIVYNFPGGPGGRVPVARQQEGEKALHAAQEAVQVVFDNGADLVATDPTQAERLLAEAYANLDLAEKNGILASTTAPIRARVVEGLERGWGIHEIRPSTIFTFSAEDQSFDLGALVMGPDGAPYVLDRAGSAVYRVDLKTRKAQVVAKEGTAVAGTKVGAPRLLGLGGPDVLILDDRNALWRWRPADNKGTGTLKRIPVAEASVWGTDIAAMGTLDANVEAGLYNLYVADPSEQQIRRYTMVLDGSGYSGVGTDYFSTRREVGGVTSMYIDGELYLADDGAIFQFSAGRTTGWEAGALPDALLRPTVRITAIGSPDGRASGTLYGFDALAGRLLAFEKKSGAYLAQYRLAGDADWTRLRGFSVVRQASGATIYWVEGSSLRSAVLPVPGEEAPASPSPSVTPVASESASPVVTPTRKPGKTPKPTRAP